MPLSYRQDLCWHDNINNTLFLKSWQAHLAGLLNSFNTHWVESRAVYHFADETTVKGMVSNRFFRMILDTCVELDPVSHFRNIQVGEYRFTPKAPGA